MDGQAMRARILGLMRERRITDRQLATKLGWAGDDLIALLGGRRNPTLSEIEALALALNARPGQLLGEDDRACDDVLFPAVPR